jgi:uncharacterized protein (DUF305 family)
VLLISPPLIFLLCAAALFAQDAPIVVPGAPGQPSKTITQAEAVFKIAPPADADVAFMQGMIMHHNQAVEMTALMMKRTHNKALLDLGTRISISQTDEMKSMKQWLEDRGKPTTMDHSHMAHMPGMNMSSMMMMPGMLTPQQMQDLAKASGATFDRLFLTGMIQHHTGALTMVQDLFNSPGAGQDPVLFDFATDVDNTQRAEINIMQQMLEKKK